MKSNLPSIIPSLPAGKYWVCDPCYAYPDDEWQDFCDILQSKGEGWHAYGRHEFFVWGTAFGDGLYELNGPRTLDHLGVDAGLLSIIPEALVKKWGSVKEMKRLVGMNLVALIELKEEATVEESGGNVKFGGYEVITDGSDCPDDEDDE